MRSNLQVDLIAKTDYGSFISQKYSVVTLSCFNKKKTILHIKILVKYVDQCRPTNYK